MFRKEKRDESVLACGAVFCVGKLRGKEKDREREREREEEESDALLQPARFSPNEGRTLIGRENYSDRRVEIRENVSGLSLEPRVIDRRDPISPGIMKFSRENGTILPFLVISLWKKHAERAIFLISSKIYSY